MKRFSQKRRLEEDDFENDSGTFSSPVNESDKQISSALSKPLIAIVNQPVKRKNKPPNKYHVHLKHFWLAGYDIWWDEEFKKRMRINRETFDLILERITLLI